MTEETGVPAEQKEVELPVAMQDAMQEVGKKPNPLLDRARMPGETYRLPSCGAFYNNGELADDVDNGEVHIHPMTGSDEIILASAAKLFSGDAIIEVIERCVPQINSAKRLLSQDVDFILLCLRKISYGPQFEFKKLHFGCPKVLELNEDRPEDQKLAFPQHTYEADMTRIISATKEIDQTRINTLLRIELGNGQIVKMRPLIFEDYVKLMQSSAKDTEEASVEKQTEDLINNLASLISSVDEITDREMIVEWLRIITPRMIRDLTNSIDELTKWGVDTEVKVKCQDCGSLMEVEIPTNPLVLFS